jgi:hypothetical protein
MLQGSLFFNNRLVTYFEKRFQYFNKNCSCDLFAAPIIPDSAGYLGNRFLTRRFVGRRIGNKYCNAKCRRSGSVISRLFGFL